MTRSQQSFNRRRDACFLATLSVLVDGLAVPCFNRRRDACFLATASQSMRERGQPCFNRRRDACFLATGFASESTSDAAVFQSQTRRLLPRNLFLSFPVGKSGN